MIMPINRENKSQIKLYILGDKDRFQKGEQSRVIFRQSEMRTDFTNRITVPVLQEEGALPP